MKTNNPEIEDSLNFLEEYGNKECGLNNDVGDMTFSETALMERALDEHLEYILGKKLHSEYAYDYCGYKEKFGNVKITFKTTEENGKAEIEIMFLLPDQHVISEKFDNIKTMLSFIDSALGVLILEPACHIFGILDRISASKLNTTDLTDVVVKTVDFKTMDTEKQSLREYLVDSLKDGLKKLEKKEGENEE